MAPVIDTLRLTAEGAKGLLERGEISAAELHSAYLDAIGDPMDEEGYVHLPQGPGMGYRLVWDYIEANRIE